MLSRLLKYDFRAMLKYWWIAALSSMGLSVLGGVCAVILDNEYNQHFSFTAIAGLGIILTVLGMSAFMVLSQVLIYVRFYRHFYTDEGYLTFTLPVKRCHLLSSKVIAAVTTTVLTGIVLVADLVIIMAIVQGDKLFDAALWERRLRVVRDLWNSVGGGFFVTYGVEILLLLLSLAVFSVMLMFCCITFAGVVVKKHKVLAAIGFCYGASAVLSFVMQWVTLFGIYGVEGWFYTLSDAAVKSVIALALLAIILFVALVSVGLYVLNLWMIDRRLNLS